MPPPIVSAVCRSPSPGPPARLPPPPADPPAPPPQPLATRLAPGGRRRPALAAGVVRPGGLVRGPGELVQAGDVCDEHLGRAAHVIGQEPDVITVDADHLQVGIVVFFRHLAALPVLKK